MAKKPTNKQKNKRKNRKPLVKWSDKERNRVGTTIESFKKGTLKSGSGKKVTNQKQAIAIAMNQTRIRRSKRK